MESNALLPVTLLLMGLGLFFLEAVVPSFGLITVFGITSVVASVVLAFQVSPLMGVVFAVLAVLSVPLAVVFFFYVVKRTRIVHSEDESGYTAPNREAEGLVGKDGIAVSDLRPTGIARIEGRRVDVVAESSFVEEGSRIRIERVDGIKIIVGEVTK